jgi:hypothetical protein
MGHNPIGKGKSRSKQRRRKQLTIQERTPPPPPADEERMKERMDLQSWQARIVCSLEILLIVIGWIWQSDGASRQQVDEGCAKALIDRDHEVLPEVFSLAISLT